MRLRETSNTDKVTKLTAAAKPGAAAVSRRQYATAKDWLSHRHIIEHLYLDEDKTLDQLINIMASEFGFHAT